MSKFCIDLEGMMLPDAIAAVVEAWYEAQNVDNLTESKNAPFRAGDPIEVRESASPGSPWRRGWIFYKACDTKVGICLASKWNYQLNKPEYLASVGADYRGDVFTNPTVSGCRLKMPKNVRRVVMQPWEKQQMHASV